MWKYRLVGDWHELDDELGEPLYMTKEPRLADLLELIAKRHNQMMVVYENMDTTLQSVEDAYQNGYDDGRGEAEQERYDTGYDDGYLSGKADGYNKGYAEGYKRGLVDIIACEDKLTQ